MDILSTYAIYLLLGAVAGTLSGLLGIGGGVIVVPGLIWLFADQGMANSVIMQVAAGTSLAAMIVTAGFSLYAHQRQGAVFEAILYLIIPSLVIGTALGSVIAHFSNFQVLKALFGVLLIVISIKEFFSNEIKSEMTPNSYFGKYGVMAGSSIIGLMSGLFGVGGGTMLIPFLKYCGLNLRSAISTTIACGLTIALIGTGVFILMGLNQPNLPAHSMGYIYLPAWIGVSIASPLFAFLGVRLHRQLKVAALKKIFSVLLMFVGIRLLI